MSIAYRLPDGAALEFEQPVSGSEIAERISKKLAKQALAVKVDGQLRDVYLTVPAGATVQIITREDADALELIRHDAAHVMAEAVQELVPGTQVTIGPTIENGFYYDFHREQPFTPDDLKAIEKRMQDIVRRNEEIRRRPGILTGCFLIGYGVFRIVGETFREPDNFIGFLAGGTTMGQWLSLPMVLFGLFSIWRARRAGPVASAK